MALNLDPLVPIFQSNIDAIINQMGKYCLLYFEPTVSGLTSHFDDRIRSGDIRKPSFASSTQDPGPSITNNTEVVKALIKYDPKEFRSFNANIDKSQGIVRLKTYLTDVPSLMKAKYIIPSYDASSTIYTKYKLIREPIPKGLKVDRYAVSYWERI